MAEKKGFDLAAVLGNVSNLDTDKEQIEYIDIDLLDDDPNNFYELSELDSLAANIELLGLQQPLRVRTNPDDSSRVIIVSGHRRRAAIQKLVEDGKAQFREIPCIREKSEESAAMQELRLIYANSDTRKLSSADLSKQAVRVEELLYKLKEEGVEFPGRMRDHVAQACQVSKSKLARLKVIRENLLPSYMKLYEDGKLSESVAYEIAKMPTVHQSFIEIHRDVLKVGITNWGTSTAVVYATRMAKIDEVVCKGGGTCTNRKNKYLASLARQTWDSDSICAKCCNKCERLVSCKYACPGLAGKIKKLKESEKARKEQEKLAQQETDAPKIQKIEDIWYRFGNARLDAGKSVQECYQAMGRYFESPFAEGFEERESLSTQFTPTSDLPYGSIRLFEVERLVNIAELLGCSIDYLLCRTDVPQMDATHPPVEGWLPLQWIDGRESPKKENQKAVAVFDIPGLKKPWKRLAEWNGQAWVVDHAVMLDPCLRWFPIPEDE